MFWTPERINELTKLWNAGLTTSEIGMQLGISKNAVVGKAHRLHLSARPSPIKRSGRPRMAMRPMAPRLPVSPAVAGAPAPAPRTRHVAPPRVVELSNHACRWPIGHPGEQGFHFCTERAVVGKPYCSEHAAMAYIKVKPKTGEAA
jgi:GcrA cell cycle regulator